MKVFDTDADLIWVLGAGYVLGLVLLYKVFRHPAVKKKYPVILATSYAFLLIGIIANFIPSIEGLVNAHNVFFSIWSVCSLFSIMYIWFFMLIDCARRSFDAKNTKKLWFISLLFGHLIVLPFYFVKVYNRKV